MHILSSLNRALYLSYICRIMCDSKLAEGLGLCFEPQGDPATFKDELSAPRETLINAGQCNIPLCLKGSCQLVSGCLYKRSSEERIYSGLEVSQDKAKKLKKNTTIIFFHNYHGFFFHYDQFSFSIHFLLLLIHFYCFYYYYRYIQIHIFSFSFFLENRNSDVVAQQYQKPISIKTQARLFLLFLSQLCLQQQNCLRQSLTYKT